MPDGEILHENGRSVLWDLTEDYHDEYALRVGPAYIEFSGVQWADHVLLLQSADGGGYVSVSHDTDHKDISETLRDKLLALRDE